MRSGILFISLSVVFCAPALAYDWSTNPGDGSAENPYQISTPEQLMSIGSDKVLLAKHFILMNDIDLAGYTFTAALIAPDTDLSRHAFQGTRFCGSFNGNYHVIANMRIINPSADCLGLFGATLKSYLGPSRIRNIGLVNASVQGDCGVGALVAVFESHNPLENCFATGRITGKQDVGGLVGACCDGSVTNCCVEVSVAGNRNVGGLLGYSRSVKNCYAKGFVSGESYVGGLIGYAAGDVENCYSAAHITSEGSLAVGGLIGSSRKVSNSFWDYEVADWTYSANGKRYRTSQMKIAETFSANNWGTGDWKINEGEYPRLAWEASKGALIENPIVQWRGSGTPEDPWQLATCKDLITLATGSFYWDKHYDLQENIDFTGSQLKPIGYDEYNAFTGTFDGNGHILINLQITDPYTTYTGMFGYVRNGYIRNLGLKDVLVKVSDSFGAGGIAGLLRNSKIETCFVKGTIKSGAGAGGISGYCYNSKIWNCYVQGTVSGNNYVGGISGQYVASVITDILNCYSTAQIDCQAPGSFFGGILGEPFVTALCYYLNTSCAIVDRQALTEEQMKQRDSFVDWDFMGETENGKQHIWGIHEGNDYPRLWWEFTNAKPIADTNDVVAYAWVDGFAQVRLDGTRSYDEDGDSLTYAWYNDANELIAVGAEPNVVFGAGEHVIHLVVNDGIEDSLPDECVVTVLGAQEVPAKIFGGNVNPKSKKAQIKGRLEFAGAQMPELGAGQALTLLTGELEIEAASQKLVYSAEDSKWFLTGEFELYSLLPGLAAGANQVTLVSRYASGQWVYGTDRLKMLAK
ncbi:MAG: PKD domain-containing protein [Planctomycetaceae bacterium]|nr:PKD domain-containing protein [Planctomycetaceae bacterium]